MSVTGIERPSSDQFKTCAWTCANIDQNRRRVVPGTRTPSWGRSRSRNVAMKSWRQRTLPTFVLARNERGNPPRTHSSVARSQPVELVKCDSPRKRGVLRLRGPQLAPQCGHSGAFRSQRALHNPIATLFFEVGSTRGPPLPRGIA